MVGRTLDKALDIAYKESFYNININAPLSEALTTFGADPNVYRLTVVDDELSVKGILSAMKILELSIERMCNIVEADGKLILANFLAQPVLLFQEEYIHKLHQNITLKGAVEYMMYNNTGHNI